MTELDRMRERAARYGMTRRRFLVGAGIYVGGLATDQAIERTVLDPILEEERKPRSFVSTNLSAERFAKMASREQRAALATWQVGTEMPRLVLARCTRTYMGKDHRRWMAQQGSGIRQWDGFWRVRDIPMDEQPDAEYGAWSADRLNRCDLTGEPVFQIVRGIVSSDGEEKVQRYTALLLPDGKGGVDSVTEKLA